jgi:hypothetical protein
VLIHDARRVLAAVVLTTLLAGCVNRVAGAPIGTGQIVDSDPARAPGPTGSGTEGPAPTPAIPDFPVAADGADITACYDGTCEVELRAPVTIPFAPATGLVSLTLTRVDETDGAQLSGTTVGGGTVSATIYADPGGSAVVTLNGFTIAALATVDGRAVLRMSPPS